MSFNRCGQTRSNPSRSLLHAMEVNTEVEEEPPSQAIDCTASLPLTAARPLTNRPSIKPVPNYPVSFRRKFLKSYYPDISDRQWNNWQWQIANRVCTPNQLKRFLTLSSEENAAMAGLATKLPLAITPYYLSLLVGHDMDYPLRKTVVPTINELVQMPEEADDPLNEDHQSPVPGLVHRYPDRVLFLLLDFCSTYCRYCTRSRVVGHGHLHFNRKRLEQALEYIRRTPTVRDVLLSGGDPLTLGDSRLDWLLTRLRQIKHVEIIRIGTKIPAVLPQRVTSQLVRMLKRHHPLWMSLHFTHPDECTPEASQACQRLADAGIPLGSQTVLLRHINDSVETMNGLVHRLLQMRVRPYYLYQCDPISGSSHFRTTVDKGLEIIQGLRGFTSGYAVPTYVIDAPGGGGKIPLMPEYRQGRDGCDLVLRNYEGKTYRYPDSV
ncbi:KamA family radical SAM protein [uncultured Desulfosarcina sp.]|uniref:KamA family radical SAM protein n=1 Tax=uncultured Desulfosarcina sp. TaxID=218289 RepID=UPI0029C90778|nr:KamA family radical SAM protein [uncultured Desulfosarcina sp.]